MEIEYLMSDAGGDISLRDDDLRQPFLVGPARQHSFLTLGNYFSTIRNFILKEDAAQLLEVLGRMRQTTVRRADLARLCLRSEKHGAFYHIASLEIMIDHQPFKLAVTTAVHAAARNCLRREFNLMSLLAGKASTHDLPDVYFYGEQTWQQGESKETFSLMVGEWLDDYHEWHYSLNLQNRKPGICLWDNQAGNHFLTAAEGGELIRQAAGILSRTYDTLSGRQIWPWHHAAGDFIVRCKRGTIDVKLITVRGYDFQDFLATGDIPPQAGLIFFFLHLSIRLRLDRWDGVGELVWMNQPLVRPIIAGFLDGLMARETNGACRGGAATEFLALLQTFTEHELHDLCQPLLHFYRHENGAELAVITANLKEHLGQLHRTIRHYRL